MAVQTLLLDVCGLTRERRQEGKLVRYNEYHKYGAEYFAVHRKVRAHLGKASLYHCVSCLKRARDWSHEHDTDPKDVNNYWPRCTSCHQLYDVGYTKKAGYTIKERREMLIPDYKRITPF